MTSHSPLSRCNRGLLLFSWVLLLATFISCDLIQEPRKNVLLLIVDDLRPEIGAWKNSHIITPNIDKLANLGTSFTRAYCQYANCNPSRISFLSGLSPETTGHQTKFNQYQKVVDHQSMPAYFRSQGYFTASLGKVYHNARDDQKSWSYYYDAVDTITYNNWECYALPFNRQLTSNRPAVEKAEQPSSQYNDFRIANAAVDQIRQIGRQPFFMAVGFRKPHLPFAAPLKYWELYKASDIPTSVFTDAPVEGDTIVYQWSELASYHPYDSTYLADNYRRKKISESDSRILRHGYFACISFIDDLIGMVLRELKDSGLHKNTVIVLLSDHGYQLGEQQIWGKHSCYNLSTRVPMIIHDPTLKMKERTSAKFVELLDLYPTLIDLCNLPQVDHLDGRSFATLLSDDFNDNFERDFSAAFNQYQSFQNDSAIGNLMAYALHSQDYTYIEWKDLASHQRNVVQRELYRLNDSRVEQKNVASDPRYQSIIDTLSGKLREYFDPYTDNHTNYQKQLKLLR